MALDKAGNIFAADTGNNVVKMFDEKVSFLQSVGSQGSGDVKLNRPGSVAVDAADKLLVADNGNHRMCIFDPQGTFMQSFGKRGSAEGKLESPRGVALNSDGKIMVADTENNRVQIFDAQGKVSAVQAVPRANFRVRIILRWTTAISS